jgi:hypothetical protein
VTDGASQDLPQPVRNEQDEKNTVPGESWAVFSAFPPVPEREYLTGEKLLQ